MALFFILIFFFVLDFLKFLPLTSPIGLTQTTREFLVLV
jgi:hypothetical protein